MKGFTLIGRSTQIQLEYYLEFWNCDTSNVHLLFKEEAKGPINANGSIVNFTKIKRITEIHNLLRQQGVSPSIVINARTLEEDLETESIRQWATNRNFIAYWETVASLDAVISRWIAYKQAKINDIRLYGPGWSEHHQYPNQHF